MDTHVFILGSALVVIASFIFNILSKKTNIPSVLMLMGLGFGIQQFAQFDQAALLPYLEILGTVGVILIVLEASLDLHLDAEKKPLIIKAALLALLLLAATAGLIAVVLVYMLEMDFLVAMLYAVPLGVLSSAIIIPSVGSLRPYVKEFLIFESALSDIIGIIFFYALLDFYKAGGTPSVIFAVGGKILLTMALSVIISYALIFMFQYITEKVRLFVLIAVLMGLYAAGKLLHLSPLILIMVFGLAMSNKKLFFRGGLIHLIKDKQFENILKDLHFITLETAFVVRTFFFVAFGMSIVISSLLNTIVPIITVIVLAIIYLTRFIGLKAATPDILQPAIYVAPRGLITVLLFYGIPEELVSPSFEPGIILLTILVTNLVMTFGLIKAQSNPPSDGEPDSTSEAPATEVVTPVEHVASASTPPSSDAPHS